MRSAVALVGLLAALALVGSGGATSTRDHANPTWSLDGARIAYSVQGTAGGAIETAAADGSSVHRLFPINDNCCGTLLWAAGDRIVFEANYQLFSVSADGGKPTKLFGDTPWFIMSPNGETAAVDYGCGCGHAPDAIAFVNVHGGKPVVVAKPKTMTDTIDGFSADGTLLVFSRQKFDPNGGRVPPPTLMAVHAGRSTPVTLAHSGLIGATELPQGATNVQWSPDGNWIAFAGAGGLRVVSTHGGTSRLIARVPKYGSFAWSPTSKLLAYTTTPGYGRLVTVDTAGHRRILWANASLHYVTNDSWNRPQWSPDGTQLVFMALHGKGRPPAAQVWVVGADGTGLHQVG
jgi:Tol biopolymer transport system component